MGSSAASMRAGQCTIIGVAIPPSCTHVLCLRNGVFETLDHPGPKHR